MTNGRERSLPDAIVPREVGKMIDLTNETVLNFADAASRLPRRRAGKKPHVATLYRWAMGGCRGVKLETIRVGGTLCTSVEALQRFCERLSNPGSDSPRLPTTKQRERQIDKAERELEQAGI